MKEIEQDVAPRSTLKGISLCSGIGGIDLGLHLAMGNRYRTVCHVEREAFAAAVLVARMEEKALDQAPIWSDIESFDGKPWRGIVDLVHGGVPCQPFSVGGKQRGVEDERWLWPEMWRIVQETRAPLVFLENVGNFIRDGLEPVLRDLAGAGYDAIWTRLSAAEVGANHLRQRFFLLAYTDRERLARRWTECELETTGEEIEIGGSSWWGTEPKICRVDAGVPHRMDRLHALGNSVVPRMAAQAWIELTSDVMGVDA